MDESNHPDSNQAAAEEEMGTRGPWPLLPPADEIGDDQNEVESTQQQGTFNEGNKPRPVIVRAFNWFHKEAKLSDWIIAIFTIVIGIATIVQAVIAYHAVKDSGIEAEKMIRAANTQAKAARDFADSAIRTEGTIKAAEGDFQAMANSSKQSIEATQNAMRLDQRAWVAQVGMTMDAPEVGKQIHGSVTWSNSGRSFAKKVKPLCHFSFVPDELAREDSLTKLVSRGSTAVGFGSIGVLAPNAEYKTPLESMKPLSEMDKYRISVEWYTYIWGELTYDDVFHQPHTTIFCSFRHGSTGDFIQCPFHNDAN